MDASNTHATICLLAGLVVLPGFGCASAVPDLHYTTAFERPTYAEVKPRLPPPAPNNGRIVVFQRLDLDPYVGAAPTFWEPRSLVRLILDDRDGEEFNLLNNHVVIGDQPAGRHSLKLVERGAFGTEDQKGLVVFDLAPGGTAYVLVTDGDRRLLQMAEPDAVSQLAGLRYWQGVNIKIPGQVVPAPE